MIISNKTKTGKNIGSVSKWSTKDLVLVRCEKCNSERWLVYAVATAGLNRTGKNLCKSCGLTGRVIPHNPLLNRERFNLRREKNSRWNGGEYINKDGYKMVKIYDGIKKDSEGKRISGYKSYEKEHRVVIEKYLGRKLIKGEVVHHIDGNRLNNDIENLVVLKHSQHHRITHQSLQEIGYELVKSGLVVFDRKNNKYVAHLKLRELLEHLEADNQQPSTDGDDCEGSETRDETS